MFPIKEISYNYIGDEILVNIIFHHPWFFDRLKHDDGDYLLYASNDSLMIRRVWLKTALKDLRDKKIIFSDIEYHTNYVEIYFKEAK
jgi:hypothetical protein